MHTKMDTGSGAAAQLSGNTLTCNNPNPVSEAQIPVGLAKCACFLFAVAVLLFFLYNILMQFTIIFQILPANKLSIALHVCV